MPIFERVFSVGLLLLGAAAPAYAFDGTTTSGAVSPAVSVDVVPRGAVSGATLGAPLAGPAPARAAPGLTAPGAAAPKLTAVEAFRSGAQALRAGDTKSGVTALEYAAANGHAIAQWKLGRMYAEGDGVNRDDLRAFEYFRGIADAHADDNPGTPQARFVANAFVALGTYYLDGIPNSSIKADPERAREMFAYAASYFGDPDAQYNLGRLYLDGNGIAREPKLAARWLGLAANKGQYQAQAMLGAMLFKGDVIPRQAARGLMWLTLASDSAQPQDKWIKDLYEAAFKQATDDERSLALRYLERRLQGQSE